MPHKPLRRASAAAITFAAIALLPGSAGAHPADCGSSAALTAAPTAESFPDWTGNDGCANAAAVRGLDGSDAEARPAPRTA